MSKKSSIIKGTETGKNDFKGQVSPTNCLKKRLTISQKSGQRTLTDNFPKRKHTFFLNVNKLNLTHNKKKNKTTFKNIHFSHTENKYESL